MNLQTEQIVNTWYLNIELMIGDEVSFKTGSSGQEDDGFEW